MKVSIEGHYEDLKSAHGSDKVWVPDQLIVECNCGEKLRAGEYTAFCQCGADHTALVREAESIFAENHYIRPQYQDYDGETHTRAVYEASEIVQALTETVPMQRTDANDPASSQPNQALGEPVTVHNGVSPALCIKNVIVVGELDLKHRTIKRPLEAKHCWFMGGIDLRYCEFEQAVHFVGCTFYEEFNSGDDRESHTLYRKELSCNGSSFKKAAKFNSIRVEGSAYFLESSLDLEGTLAHTRTCFEREADFTAATFGRNLECNNAVFKGPVSFNSLKCDGTGSIGGAYFERQADFTAATFGRNLECNDAVFKGFVSFNAIKCGHSGFFRKAQFANQGSEAANFCFAHFGLNLFCERALFKGPVNFHATKCGHNGRFDHARFEAKKGVDFTNADLGFNWMCNSATFKGAVKARGLKCNALGSFHNATFEDEVDFRFTHFGSDLDLRHATFATTVRLGQSHLVQKLRLGRARFRGRVELYNAVIGIVEILSDRHWRDVIATMINTKRPYETPSGIERLKAGLALQHDFGRKNECLDCAKEVLFPFKKAKSLDLSDMSFQRFHAGPNKVLARKLAWKFVEEQDPKRFSRDPYLQLERYYKDIGDEAAARMAHLKGHRAFRESAKSSESPAGWNRRQSAWDLFLNLSIGYGLQAWRLLLPLFVIFALGVVVFSYPEALVYKADGSPVDDYATWWPASWWPALVYSFDLLIPVLTFPPADQWAPNGYGREMFAAVEVVIGWLLVPLMIAAWTGIVTKN